MQPTRASINLVSQLLETLIDPQNITEFVGLNLGDKTLSFFARETNSHWSQVRNSGKEKITFVKGKSVTTQFGSRKIFVHTDVLRLSNTARYTLILLLKANIHLCVKQKLSINSPHVITHHGKQERSWRPKFLEADTCDGFNEKSIEFT